MGRSGTGQRFTRLERAMRAACQLYAGRETLERWLADGFYFIATFVPEGSGDDLVEYRCARWRSCVDSGS